MAFEERDMSGALFPIEAEKRRERGPVLRGSVTIGGKRYELAAWKREGKDDKPAWLSLSAKPWGQHEAKAGRPVPKTEDDPW